MILIYLIKFGEKYFDKKDNFHISLNNKYIMFKFSWNVAENGDILFYYLMFNYYLM